MAKPATDAIWRDFIQWCAKRRLRSLPAHPWTVAAYLRWRDGQSGSKGGAVDIKAVTDAVRRAHKKAGKRSPHREPIVERTIALIKNKQEAKNAGSDLFDADSLLFSDAAPPPDAVEGDEAPSDPAETAGRKLSSTPRLVSRRPRT